MAGLVLMAPSRVSRCPEGIYPLGATLPLGSIPLRSVPFHFLGPGPFPMLFHALFPGFLNVFRSLDIRVAIFSLPTRDGCGQEQGNPEGHTRYSFHKAKFIGSWQN